MPRYNVEYKGKWACFSSIVDAFITNFMDKEAYEQWRRIQYGIADYRLAEKCNMMTMEEAVFSLTLNRSESEAIENIVSAGIQESEAADLFRKYGDKTPEDEAKYEEDG
jgi:hypothetical protein